MCHLSMLLKLAPCAVFKGKPRRVQSGWAQPNQGFCGCRPWHSRANHLFLSFLCQFFFALKLVCVAQFVAKTGEIS